MKGFLWATQAFGFYPERKLMDLMTPIRFVYWDWESKRGWCNLQATRPWYRTVKAHVKGEFYGPAIEGTTSLASCNLLWLQFYLVAVGYEELFHRSIIVKGLPWWKVLNLFQGDALLMFSSSPGQTLEPPAFQSTPSRMGISPHSRIPPLHPPNTQMICHKEEMKIKTVIVSIIRHHPQRRDQRLGWLRKAMQID